METLQFQMSIYHNNYTDYHTHWGELLYRWCWCQTTQTSHKTVDRWVPTSLDFNLCSFHVSRSGLKNGKKKKKRKTYFCWQSLTLSMHQTTPCFRSLIKIRLITLTVISKSSLTLLCHREDNSNSPLPSSALPAHPGSSLDCRQHSILWTPASSPSVRSIGTGG